MAQRPVFTPSLKKPYYTCSFPEFSWNGGFAPSQKQKNIVALHNAFLRMYPNKKVLEISSKSMQSEGVQASAFNLKKYVPSLKKSVPVECVFQGGKVFESVGPFTFLYEESPKDAKRYPLLKESGCIKSFYFEEKFIPTNPKTAFYNWLYINALTETPALAEAILQYDAFTDIEFNPQKSLNCQAEACAVFVSLAKQGKLEECKSFESLVKLFT